MKERNCFCWCDNPKSEEIDMTIENFDLTEPEMSSVGFSEYDFLKEYESDKDNKQVDRVKDWEEFAEYMRKYIEEKTVSKYGQSSGVDLMSFTDPYICVWNIIRYALRLWNNSGKRYDLEKIIHYAQMAATLSNGDLSKCGVRESNNPNEKFWLNDKESDDDTIIIT